jgi:bifunctional non-homologous end joining protein LigD
MALKRPSSRSFPRQLGLQLARLAPHAPPGDDWLHEVKFDGYRVLIWRNGSAVRITSRGDQDWSAKLSAAVRATAALPGNSCILDGELVAMDSSGKSSFGLLQRRFGQAAGGADLPVMVFDVLYLDGKDLRDQPQLERKQKLAQLLRRKHPPLALSPYTLGSGAKAAKAACAAGLEGIISKAADAPYREGRSGAWLKIKCVASDEYAIVGYTPGKGAREELGSLLLGTPEVDGRWRYWGRVGTGLNHENITRLLRRLKKAPKPVCLKNPPDRSQLRGAFAIWTKPEIVVEVEFRGLTEDGLLRQASLKGVREDRSVESLSGRKRDVARVDAHGADSDASER